VAAKECLATEPSRKRQLQAGWNERHCAKCHKQGHDYDTSYDVDHFLDLPSVEEQKDCQHAFLAATSNQALATAVCTSCSRLLFQNELLCVDYLELKNRSVFIPATPNEHHVLTYGMLLDHAHLDTSEDGLPGWIC
jgi:hypothetical protein